MNGMKNMIKIIDDKHNKKIRDWLGPIIHLEGCHPRKWRNNIKAKIK
jgi:hypothetical protein